MLLQLLQFGLLLECAMVFAAYDVSSITCVCSTTHCTEHRMSTCNTTGVCFSQYLDRKDGSHPVVRGCIASKTPLLCENRRPAVSQGPWPILVCCDSNLCNRDVVPTLPPFGPMRDNNQQDGNFAADVAQVSTQNQNKGAWKDSLKDMMDAQTTKKSEGTGPNSLLLDTKDRRNNSSNQSNGFPKIVSPVYVSVLVLGIASLVVIGIVAAVVLRRNNKFYAEQYGALRERNEEYFKHPLNAPSSSLSPSPSSFEEEEDDGECRDIVVQNPIRCCSHQKQMSPSAMDTHYYMQRNT